MDHCWDNTGVLNRRYWFTVGYDGRNDGDEILGYSIHERTQLPRWIYSHCQNYRTLERERVETIETSV